MGHTPTRPSERGTAARGADASRGSRPAPSATRTSDPSNGPLVALQRTAGNRATAALLSPARTGAPVVQRSPDTDALDEKLDKWNVPEGEVIALIERMSAPDRAVVASPRYRSLLADALNFGEMMRVVRVLPLTLEQKLQWLQYAAVLVRAVDYGEIRALVTAAPAPERAALKTSAWRDFFVKVCTNATMVTALNDLGFDLETKLTWLDAETTSTRELDLATVRPWILAASAAERAALNTPAWREYFVKVCTNATMVTLLTDLRFDLATTLTWIDAEMTWTRAELDYGDIRRWILAAPQGQRDALKTPGWRDFFSRVCTNATIETAVTDLGHPLPEKLRWMLDEGTAYPALKRVITAAADKAVALADASLLHALQDELGWNDFAKCVELLGRVIPGAGALLGNGTVQAALASAWAASNAAITTPGTPAPPSVHEEGGYVYLDLVSGSISTSRAAPGLRASLALNDPDPPDGSVTVAGFHTHPNVGPGWGAPFASTPDINWGTRNGIPLLIRGAHPTVAAISDTSTGPTRAHLAGERGFPGAAGGIAPQASLDGEVDEL